MKENRSKIISIYAAVITLIAGFIVITGWCMHSNFLWSFAPAMASVKFNTAVCFVVSSSAVLLYNLQGSTRTLHRIFVLPGCIVSLIAVLTLLEYLLNFNAGIDELFVKDNEPGVTIAAYYAGRMPLLSAINFLMIGIGLLLLNKGKAAGYQFFYLSGVVFISILVLIGFSFIADIPVFSHLSVYDAIGFIIISGAIYFAQPMLGRKIGFEVKLFTGFSGIILLIIVLSVFSSYYSDKRISTNQWVEHTNNVLFEAEQILSLSQEVESEGRGYIITGDSGYLRYFMSARDGISRHTKEIKELTKDNPLQQARADSLSALVDKQTNSLQQYIRAKNENSFEVAKSLMATLHDKFYMDAIRNVISKIQQEENHLLAQRQNERIKSISSFNKAFSVLLAFIFILLIIIFTSIRHNIAVRRKAEEKIKESEHMFSTLFYKSPVLKTIGEISTGKYVTVNDAFADFLGLRKEDVLGKTSVEMNLLAQPEERSRVIKDIQKDGFVRDLEIQLSSGNGKGRWISTNVDIINLNGKDCLLSASIDITKRKTAEEKLIKLSHDLEAKVLERTEELNRSEKRYRYLFENNPMPMWVIDLNTFKFLDVNEMAILQYGFSREEFLSMTAMDIRPEADKDLFKGSDHSLTISSANYNRGLWNHRKKDGSIIQVEIVAHSIIFEGIPARFIVSNDVTKRKQAEEKLDKSEKLFRAMIEKDADMKALATPEGKVFYASPSITKILGYENDEFMAMTVPDLIHPGDVAALIKGVKGIVQKPGESFYIQQRLKHKNGNWLWCEGTIANMLQEPAVAAFVSNFRDITERKEAEELVKQVETNYREIFENANDAIYVHEMWTGKVIEVNNKASKLTGYTKEELLNTNPQEFISGDPGYTLQHAMNYLQKAAMGEPQFFEWMSKNKDGSINWLEVSLKKASIGGEDRILAFFHEINDRKKAQLEIQKLNEELEQKVISRTQQLEQANKELEAFSYSVSHDLRAPLRAINGFAKMLLENYHTLLDDEGKRLFNRIPENARKMGVLIDDLLEFSRLGRKEIHKSTIQMTQLVEGVLTEINVTTNHKATIQIHRLHSANADSAMIKQVVMNLLSNAIKYSSKTEKARIEVKSYTGENEIIYSVSDNGVGFDNQYIHKLFGVFQRLHLKADFEGTGVGLALVKRIIDKHEGRVWATGELNKGATFFFSLPSTNN